MSVGLDHRLGRVDSLSDLSIVVLSCMVNNHHGTAKYDDPLKQTHHFKVLTIMQQTMHRHENTTIET